MVVVMEKTYFSCKNKYGVFVRFEHLNDILYREETLKQLDSPLKDNSLLFRDCTIKVEDIKKDKNINNMKKENNAEELIAKDLLEDNYQLSRINEYSKEICKLKKLLKSKENEIQENENKYKKEIEVHKKLLDKETVKSQELLKTLTDTKSKFIRTIDGYSKETNLILTEIKEIFNELDSLKPTNVDCKKHKTICDTFKEMLFNFIEEEKSELDKNIQKLNTLL